MSKEKAGKSKIHTDFWRACRYMFPHRRLMVTSILCAIVVSLAFTTGLSTMVPILKILIEGDSLQSWVDRQVVGKRLDIRLVDTAGRVQIDRINPESPLASTGLTTGEQIVGIGAAPAGQSAGDILRVLSDPATTEVVLHGEIHQATAPVALGEVSSALAIGRNIAYALPTDPVWAIAAVFGILASLAIFGNIVKFFQEYLADKVAILTVTDIRRHLYDHSLHMPMGFYAQRGTSDVTSRLIQDSTTLFEGFKAILGKTIQEPINVAFTFSLAMYINWKLTLFIVLFAPFMIVLINKFGKKMRRASKRMLQSSAAMLSQLEGSLIGVRVVKASGAERYERRRFNRVQRELNEQQFRMIRLDAMTSPILESLTLVLAGFIILVAAYMVLKADPQELTPTAFLLVMGCLAGMADSLRKVSKVNNSLQKSNAAAGRIFEVMGQPMERRRTVQSDGRTTNLVEDGEKNLPPIEREIRFENVTFTYPNAQSPALQDVNLVVPKGRSVAVVGRNGSGKTTLLALLPRFYEPDSGRILLDGVDIRQGNLRSLRSQIGIVTQDSVVFPGTILQNIAYGVPDRKINRQRAEDAARRAFAHEFIMEKADGYDTVLGEHGAQLSGGQKQRICIARAIYRDAPILILDEATSQIDAESEHLIQQAIELLMQERTVFVIAHRFSTILSADTIVVIDRGRVVGEGTHEQLMQTCPIYLQLYERQLMGTPISAAGEIVSAPRD